MEPDSFEAGFFTCFAVVLLSYLAAKAFLYLASSWV